MKFTLALALAGLVSSIGAVETKRGLTSTYSPGSVESDYYVASFGATPINSPTSAEFTLTAVHGKGDGGGLTSAFKVFQRCPQGNTADSPNQADTIASLAPATGLNPELTSTATAANGWLTFSTPVVSGSFTTTSTMTVSTNVVNFDVFAENFAADTGVATFCVWFGLGTTDSAYGASAADPMFFGFREIEFTVTFDFDGTWACTGFSTQAFDPTTGTTSRDITAQVNMDCMPEVVYPGIWGCITVCPVGTTGVSIAEITELVMKEISLPDTSAADLSGVVGTRRGLEEGSKKGVGLIKCKKCDDDKTKPPKTQKPTQPPETQPPATEAPHNCRDTCEFDAEAVIDITIPVKQSVDGCCRKLEFLLPHPFFPQYSQDAPAYATFNLIGTGLFGASENCDATEAPVAGGGRFLFERGLQAETGKAYISSQVSMPMNGPPEESSAKGSIAGAAAAVGALGAALLI